MNVRKALLPLALVAALFVCVDAKAADVVVNRVDVPFDFVVNGRTLPAGTYRFDKTGAIQNVLIIRNINTGDNVTTLVYPEAETRGTSKLLFDDVGGVHILRSVVTPSTYATVSSAGQSRRMAEMRTSDATGGR